MSTRFRAWLLGASVASVGVGLINHRFIDGPQRDMLLGLRQALLSHDVRQKLDYVSTDSRPRFPLFSRQTLNLVLIAISDRFLFQHDNEERS